MSLIDKLKKAVRKAVSPKKTTSTRNSGRSRGKATQKVKPKKQSSSNSKSKSSNNTTKSQTSQKQTNRGSQTQSRSGINLKGSLNDTKKKYNTTSWEQYAKDHISKSESLTDSAKKRRDAYRTKLESDTKKNTADKKKQKETSQKLSSSISNVVNTVGGVTQGVKDYSRSSQYAMDAVNASKDTVKQARKYWKSQGYSDDDINSYLKTKEGKSAINDAINDNVNAYRKQNAMAYADAYADAYRQRAKDKVAQYNKADEKNLQKTTRAKQLGATGEDVVEATKQSAKTNVKLHEGNAGTRFAWNVAQSALPSVHTDTEWGDKDYYTDEMKESIAKGNESLAGGLGTMAGSMAQYALPMGVATKIGSTAFKGAKAGKIINNVVTKAGRSPLKNADTIGKFIGGVGLESALNTPFNTMMAYRDSKDIDGNVSMGQFGKKIAEYEGMDLLAGGAFKGVGMGLTKAQAKKLINLQTRINNGEILAGKDLESFNKLKEKMSTKALDTYSPSSNIADNSLDKIRSTNFKADASMPTVTGNGKAPVNDVPESTKKWRKKREEQKAIAQEERAKAKAKTEADNAKIAEREAEEAERKATIEEARKIGEEKYNAEVERRQTEARAKRDANIDAIAERKVNAQEQAVTEEAFDDIKGLKGYKRKIKRVAQKIANGETVSEQEKVFMENESRKLDEIYESLGKKGMAKAVRKVKLKQVADMEGMGITRSEELPWNKDRALTKEEGRELAKLKHKQNVGLSNFEENSRIAELEDKIANQKTNSEKPNTETKSGELTDKQKQYKSVGIGHKEVTELTDEQLQKELESIEIVRERSNKKNGGLSENQKIREERYKELEAELNNRGIERNAKDTTSKEVKSKDKPQRIGVVEETGREHEDAIELLADEKNMTYNTLVDLNVKGGMMNHVALANKYGVDIDKDLNEYIKARRNTQRDGANASAEDIANETNSARRIYDKVKREITRQQNLKNNKKVKEYNAKTDTEKRAEGTPETVMKNAESGEVTGREIAESYKNIKLKEIDEVDRSFANRVTSGMKKGRAEEKKKAVQELRNARKEVESDADGVYDHIMRTESGLEDTLKAKAQRTALLEKYANEGDGEKFIKLLDKDTEIAELNGEAERVIANMREATPEARVRYLKSVADRMSETFKGRLKSGDKIQLNKDDVSAILNAKDADDAIEKLNNAYAHMWDNVKATWFEKANELRHFAMLFNVKTHGRNIIGNTAYAVVRQFAEIGEEALSHTGVVQNRLKKLAGEDARVHMVHVTTNELLENKGVVDGIFDAHYKFSNSKTRFRETVRPEGSKTFSYEPFNKMVNANYGLLEVEDIKFALKPTFRKNFMRYAKSMEWDIKNLTKEQADEASKWAMYKAEEATFRDSTALSKKITKLKQTTANKKGKTWAGTLGYRMANVALEGVLPFVKTPINIMARSMDYSPAGLIKGLLECTSKDADTFLRGIHRTCTGFTGTGIAGFGMFAFCQGFVTVKAGEVSGDAYYDRDMNYQDYSLVVTNPLNGSEYSVPIDWASPLQSSFFMGASFMKALKDKDDDTPLEEAFDVMLAMSEPVLDMSFMSSAKQTIETFTEKVYRNGTGEDADWTGAMLQTLGGSMPQNYIGGFIPQLVTQSAQFTDKYQRDVRSTKEGTLEASWDRFGKQVANKIPVLRKVVLEKKVDRRGELVTGAGSNLATRFLFSCISPANVKRIYRTETDDKLIAVFNDMTPEEKKNSSIFYNLTGNPSYDLKEGERMNNEELYKFGKEKRSKQWKYIEDMFDSGDRVDCMTNQMKVKEIEKYHWISNTDADVKTFANKEGYGYEYVADNIVKGDSSVALMLATTRAKNKAFGGDDKDFVDAYKSVEMIQAKCHTTNDYHVKAMGLYNMSDSMQKAYGIYGDKIKTATDYIKKQGGSLKEFATSYCEGISVCEKEEIGTNKANRSRGMAEFDNIPRRAYIAMGYEWNPAQAGAGLKKYGFSPKECDSLKDKALMSADKDNSNTLTKDEAIAFVESQNYETDDIKACVFEMISTAKNPFGVIFDHLEWGTEPPEDTTNKSGYGRRGRRGRGGYGHGGGGSGSGANDWYAFVKDMTTASTGTSTATKVSDNTKKSKLDNAYRKRVRKLTK